MYRSTLGKSWTTRPAEALRLRLPFLLSLELLQSQLVQASFAPFCRDKELAESHGLRIKMLVRQYELQSATVAQFDDLLQELIADHPDSQFFMDLKGVGPAIGARLIAAFEMEAGNCAMADQLSARCRNLACRLHQRKEYRFSTSCTKSLQPMPQADLSRLCGIARGSGAVGTKARYRQLKVQERQTHRRDPQDRPFQDSRCRQKLANQQALSDAERYFTKITVDQP